MTDDEDEVRNEAQEINRRLIQECDRKDQGIRRLRLEKANLAPRQCSELGRAHQSSSRARNTPRRHGYKYRQHKCRRCRVRWRKIPA